MKSGQIFSSAGDRRFRGTEEAIFNVFADSGAKLSIKIVIRRAGISSSTFYRHHKSINNLLYDYEHMIMENFRKFVQEPAGHKKTNFRQVIYRMLVFIMLNKRIIKVVASRDNYLIIYRMVKTLKNWIVMAKYLISDENRIFDIYVCEVCGVIKNWHEDDYPECVLMKIENDIVYLTLTIGDRLGKLAG
jgi:AcrR family transcriptional regulator